MGIDPVQPNVDNLHSLNRYAYANNNPYRYIDPDGRRALEALGGVLQETWDWLTGDEDGFEGGMIAGALANGYNGEGDGFWSALGNDTFDFAGGAIGGITKGYKLLKGLGSFSGSAKNGVGQIYSPSVTLSGKNITFGDFTIGTQRGLLGTGPKGAAELIAPMKELIKFSQQSGANTITLTGKYATKEGAALGGGKVKESFSFSFPATQKGFKNLLGGLRK